MAFSGDNLALYNHTLEINSLRAGSASLSAVLDALNASTTDANAALVAGLSALLVMLDDFITDTKRTGRATLIQTCQITDTEVQDALALADEMENIFE